MFVAMAVDRIPWAVTILATVVLLFRLWRETLLTHYRFFSAYLALSLLSAAVVFPLNGKTTAYAYVYFAFEILFWLLQVLVTLELFTVVLRRYPGIATLGARAVKFSFAAALAISLLSVTIPSSSHQYPTLDKFYLVSRVVYLSVFVFLALMVFLLLWFPVPLSRNAVRYAIGYAIFLPAKAAALFTVNLFGPELTTAMSAGFLSIDAACLIYWAITLHKAGEESIVTIGHTWNPQEEVRLVQQLESINTSLLRTARK